MAKLLIVWALWEAQFRWSHSPRRPEFLRSTTTRLEETLETIFVVIVGLMFTWTLWFINNYVMALTLPRIAAICALIVLRRKVRQLEASQPRVV